MDVHGKLGFRDSSPVPPAVYEFTYGDPHAPGKSIRERLCIDRQGGLFEWRRFTANRSGLIGHGGAWSIAMIHGVRFTTKCGDPSREFLTATQAHQVRKKERIEWLSQVAISAISVMGYVVNPLTLSFILSCVLTGELWRAFPTSSNGMYNMSEPAEESALVWSTVLALLAFLATLFAGWWLRIFRCSCCRSCGLDQDRAMYGYIARLSPNGSERWNVQRPINMSVLLLFLFWCVFTAIFCPVAAAVNAQEECLPTNSTGDLPQIVSMELGLLDVTLGAGTDVTDSCFTADGVPLPCGVGSCSCSASLELGCSIPPKRTVPCQNVPRPLCAGDNSIVEPSGIHGWLLFAAITSAVLCCLLGLCWLMNEVGMFLADDLTVPVRTPRVHYHRFEVSFRHGKVAALVFTLSHKEDPLAVFSALTGVGKARSTVPLLLEPSAGVGLRGLASVDPLAPSEEPPFPDDLEPQWC